MNEIRFVRQACFGFFSIRLTSSLALFPAAALVRVVLLRVVAKVQNPNANKKVCERGTDGRGPGGWTHSMYCSCYSLSLVELRMPTTRPWIRITYLLFLVKIRPPEFPQSSTIPSFFFLLFNFQSNLRFTSGN